MYDTLAAVAGMTAAGAVGTPCLPALPGTALPL